MSNTTNLSLVSPSSSFRTENQDKGAERERERERMWNEEVKERKMLSTDSVREQIIVYVCVCVCASVTRDVDFSHPGCEGRSCSAAPSPLPVQCSYPGQDCPAHPHLRKSECDYVRRKIRRQGSLRVNHQRTSFIIINTIKFILSISKGLEPVSIANT